MHLLVEGSLNKGDIIIEQVANSDSITSGEGLRLQNKRIATSIITNELRDKILF